MNKPLSDMIRADLPAPAPRWTGFPEFNFVGGHNDEASVPVEKLRAALDETLAREGSNLGTYFLQSGPQGYEPLRAYMCEKMQKYCGVSLEPHEILLTSGSLQAMDLVNAMFVGPGDIVIAEESNYAGAYGKLAKIGAEVVTVPLDGDGMRMDALRHALEGLKAAGKSAAMIYTIPTVHNPTGTIMPLARRHELIDTAKEYGLPIFEDECYADLVWSGERPPSLLSLAGDWPVVHCGSFSKNIAPALRVGYLAGSWEIISQLTAMKGDAGSPALEQMMLAGYCPDNFDSHLKGLNGVLEGKLDALIAALDESFGSSVEFEKPPGGIFLWVKMPEGVNTAELAEVAQNQGVAINPGREWARQADSDRWIRICYANPSAEVIHAGMARLAEICHEAFGVPEISGNRRL